MAACLASAKPAPLKEGFDDGGNVIPLKRLVGSGLFGSPRGEIFAFVVDHVQSQEREQIVDPTAWLPGPKAVIGIPGPTATPAAGGKVPLRCQMLHRGPPELREVVFALGSPHRLANRVDCRQEQAHQDAENGDDDEHLHERKGRIFLTRNRHDLVPPPKKISRRPTATTIETSVPTLEL